MIASSRQVNVVRGVVGAACGALLGLLQYWTDVAGMHRVAATRGLDGLGVAAGFGIAYLAVTLVFLLVATGLLGLRLWAAIALGLLVGETAVVAVLWDLDLGLRGDRKAILFPIVATAALGAVAVLCPRRDR